MEKINQAYTTALRDLDRAFRKARADHKALAEELDAAIREFNKYPSNIPEWDYAARAAAENAKAKYQAANGSIQGKTESIWAEYRRDLAKIRSRLVDEIKDAGTLTAADVDQAAISLLNSGTMQARDFERMAQEYAENPVVLALVRRKAAEYADSLSGGINDTDNLKERLAARAAVENAKTGGERAVESFDGWATAARTLAGQDQFGNFRTMARIKRPDGLDDWERLLSDQGISFDDADK